MVFEKLATKWQLFKDKYGERRAHYFALILLIGAVSIIIRLLAKYDFDHSALLYVGIPYLVSLALLYLKPLSSEKIWWHQFRDHSLTALIVFFASSIVLFEGFICVLFFIPIYFLFVALAFAMKWLEVRRAREKNSTFVFILPFLVALSALEGTSDELSFERNSSVIVTTVAGLTPVEIKTNLAMPFDLDGPRHWMIGLFPSPHEIQAGSLVKGDIHTVRIKYPRWLVTNVHEGEIKLQIVEVNTHSVKTRFLGDTSLYSNYLQLLGTEITFLELSPIHTQISLRIDFRRKLDPAWYFDPLQKYALSKMASFLIDEIMIREHRQQLL